jgi:hypothetical protein
MQSFATHISTQSMSLWDTIIKKFEASGQKLGSAISTLIKLADELDERGFYEQAEAVDAILLKVLYKGV